MRMYLECIPCFFMQALEAARLAGADAAAQKAILDDVARRLPDFPLEASQPEMGRIIHGLIRAHTGNPDPYREIKEKSNRSADAMSPRLEALCEGSEDRLLTAVELAIAGNIIDYGVKNTLDVDAELEKILSGTRSSSGSENGRFFQVDRFRERLARAGTVLYLADNAGETVFDRVLMETMKSLRPDLELIYAVKEKPILNDALKRDALDSGIPRVAHVMSSGSDAPGTVLSLCSRAFLDILDIVDLVISKGQGNFEGLSEIRRGVFFLLMAKCPVIAGDIGCGVGDVVLLYQEGRRKLTEDDGTKKEVGT